MLPNPGPGRLMAIEGLDGAGTTTQVRMLHQRLSQSEQVYVTHEPSDGPIGLLIRMALGHRIVVDEATLAALFAADRMDHLYHRDGEGGLFVRLSKGTHVLTDRYYLSSLAYQGMSQGWQWIWDLHACCVRADITLFVDVPVDVCLERIAAGRGGHFDLFENQNALTRARQRYLEAIERLCEAEERIEIIDGNATPEQVHAAIWRAVESILFPARPLIDSASRPRPHAEA
jgi:dTMP kinase